MPITPTNPFKWRHFPGEVLPLGVRWYLRYPLSPLSYEHVSELLVERGVAVDPICIWRWVQTDSPELNKRCRPHLKPANDRTGKHDSAGGRARWVAKEDCIAQATFVAEIFGIATWSQTRSRPNWVFIFGKTDFRNGTVCLEDVCPFDNYWGSSIFV